MTSPKQLQGTDLIDCAKANAKQGLSVASKQCGYENNIEDFQVALKQACQEIGVEIEQLSDLITDRQMNRARRGIEIAPETKSEL